MAAGKQGASAMATRSSNTSDREIFETRVFDAPRELVWKMWTDPESIRQLPGGASARLRGESALKFPPSIDSVVTSFIGYGIRT